MPQRSFLLAGLWVITEAAAIYKAAAEQYRKLKSILSRLERLSRTALVHLAKKALSGRGI